MRLVMSIFRRKWWYSHLFNALILTHIINEYFKSPYYFCYVIASDQNKLILILIIKKKLFLGCSDSISGKAFFCLERSLWVL